MVMIWIWLETAQWGVSVSDSLETLAHWCCLLLPIRPLGQGQLKRFIQNSSAAAFSLTSVCFMTVCYFQSCSYLTMRLYGLLCTINVLYETRLLCFFSFIKS